jgi:2,4-dienoyl-CoA reductase-like NADH-dependent reductase (Old Yellow Enzyme family)
LYWPWLTGPTRPDGSHLALPHHQKADIVLSAKSFLLNPDWVGDVRAGKELPLFKAEDADVAYTDKPLP